MGSCILRRAALIMFSMFLVFSLLFCLAELEDALVVDFRRLERNRELKSGTHVMHTPYFITNFHLIVALLSFLMLSSFDLVPWSFVIYSISIHCCFLLSCSPLL